MSKAAKTIMAYGVYCLGSGLGFLFMKDFILDLFQFAPTTEHWIYVVAILMVGLGYYYISSARAEAKHFFKISAIGRTWFFVASTAIALLGIAPKMLIAFGAIDLVTAIWTWVSLEKN